MTSARPFSDPPLVEIDAVAGSIQSRVRAALQTMIDDGRLQPGERLVETHVATAFGVSRSPVRASLAALWRERRLRKAEGHGYLVAGAARAATAGRLARLDVARIEPAPLWEPVYAGVEATVARHVLFHSLRLTEERLGEHFGVSRTVARDVLGRMHAVGLVGKDRPGRWLIDRLTPERLQHLYELRGLLEPAALRQALPQLPGDWLHTVRDEAQAVAGATVSQSGSRQGGNNRGGKGEARRRDAGTGTGAGRPDEAGRLQAFDRLEQALHIDLLDHCPNRELLRALQPTRLLLVLNRYLRDLAIAPTGAVAKATLDEHLQVIDLLLARDVDAACIALDQHLRHSAQLWRGRYRKAQSAAHREPLPDWLTIVTG